MFPTFISILDIQSWWEVPSIAHFCSLFRTAFNLLDFDIEDLEEALLTDGTEETSWLQELIVRLLSGCIPNNEISTFNYQMFLRRLFRQKCQEHDQYNPFNTDIDFQLLPLRTKVDILHALCDFRLDADDVLDQLKNLEADSLRVEPLGYDCNNSAYWYFYGTRLYREDFKTKNSKKKSVWQVICFTEDDWFQLNKKFKKSTSKCERQLYRTLAENFLPELPRLFREKERLARKRLLENQPRRTSRRLRKDHPQEAQETQAEAHEPRKEEEEEEECQSSGKSSSEEYEMGGTKLLRHKKPAKTRPRKLSTSSNTSKDTSPAKNPKKKKPDPAKSSSSATPTTATVGRQTNNSLAAATGQIVIQSVANPHKKKLKTSQVFRQTDEDLITGMHKILDCVKNNEDAWPFVDPVDEDYAPNYYSVIRKPMDLQRMEDRLDAGYYKSFSKFRDDFQLIVDNCRLYNGAENEYTEMVDNLLKVFERATEKYLDQISSSDDEIAVEFPKRADGKDGKRLGKAPAAPPAAPTVPELKTSKRKPTLVAKTDKKREKSLSGDEDDDEEEDKAPVKSSRKRSLSADSVEEEKIASKSKTKQQNSREKQTAGKKQTLSKKEAKKIQDTKKSTKDKKNSRANSKVQQQHNSKKEKISGNNKVARSRSSSRSESPFKRGYSSSPPPSSAPSSPDNRFDFIPKKQKTTHQNSSSGKTTGDTPAKGKLKQKQDRFKELFAADEDSNENSTSSLPKKPPAAPEKPGLAPTPAKPKDKHNKLRETIEKLKAKSVISSKHLADDEYRFDLLDTPKENKEKHHVKDTMRTAKTRKDKVNKTHRRDLTDHDNSNSTQESDSKKTKKMNARSYGIKNAAIEALTIATAETLKDINKWLDDTPKSPEFSSVSNSPSYGPPPPPPASEYDFHETTNTNSSSNNTNSSKNVPEMTAAASKSKVRKDFAGKEIKRRANNHNHRDPGKFLKRREVQRTIDRLQPGKSKGNLIANVQSAKKDQVGDELFPLGPLSHKKELMKNSLIVKTDDNAPKLSLGTVLDNFGKHKFVDDGKKAEDKDTPLLEDVKVEALPKESVTNESSETKPKPEETEKEKEDSPSSVVKAEESSMMSGATPNLSAWFKAFGAPKTSTTPALSSIKKLDKVSNIPVESKETEKSSDDKNEAKQSMGRDQEGGKTPLPEASPEMGQNIRQRRISTGSSMSERSSFSQDMDSPRVGIDERLGGAYPAPYPSPLHRSPSSGASPRPDASPKAAPYPPFNGQMRVGFYQDTVSNKSSPDNPQSPYMLQPGDHVYPPNTTAYSSYPNSPYYSQNYTATAVAPSYNPDMNNPVAVAAVTSYYDTSKSLTDQYQAKSYVASSPQAPYQQPQHSPISLIDNNTYRENKETKMVQQQQQQQINASIFPVKKRAFNKAPTEQLLRYESSIHEGVVSPSMMRGEEPGAGSLMKYVHQNIPEPKPLAVQTNNIEAAAAYNKSPVAPSQQQQQQQQSNYPPAYTNYGNENYPLNIPTGRGVVQSSSKIDISKYTNMGYSGPEVNFSRSVPHQYNRVNELGAGGGGGGGGGGYSRPNSGPNLQQQQQQQQPQQDNRYGSSNANSLHNLCYKGMEITPSSVSSQQQQQQQIVQSSSSVAVASGQQNLTSSLNSYSGISGSVVNSRLTAPVAPSVDGGGYKSEVSIPRPTYNAHLEMEQPLGLRGNIANLSHIVDRYGGEDGGGRMLATGAPPPGQYYEKGPPGGPGPPPAPPSAHAIFNKSVGGVGGGNFNQAMQQYNQNMQLGGGGVGGNAAAAAAAAAVSLYNHRHQMVELQGSQQQQQINAGEVKSVVQAKPPAEKKTKKRKSKNAAAAEPQPTQGFQSYAGLKTPAISSEPSAISLKTASVVPGSAFNFGPTPAGLSLYGDKDAYPNFLDDFRPAPNYYIAAAHRGADPPEKQGAAPQPPPSYPFMGAPQARPPSYPLGSPFMASAQAPLMDAGSPLYQHYLHSGVLNQGLLGPAGYPPGYPLAMRQPPYDSMTRPPWL